MRAPLVRFNAVAALFSARADVEIWILAPDPGKSAR